MAARREPPAPRPPEDDFEQLWSPLADGQAERMPSVVHQVVVELLREHPELVLRLLQDVPGLELPSGAAAVAGSTDLGKAVPTEYSADAVIELRRPGASRAEFAIVVEVQLRRDADKPWSWVAYVANAHARLRCPVCLLVVTPRASVAQWALRRIEIGPGCSLQPVVLGPGEIPPVMDSELAQSSPELALLSVMVHGRGRDPKLAARIAAVVLAAFAELDEERGVLYCDLAEASLSPGAMKEMKGMRAEGHKWQGPTARKAFGEGEAKGKAEDVLEALEVRGLVVTDEQRARVLSCTDVAQLRTWHRRAIVAERTSDVF